MAAAGGTLTMRGGRGLGTLLIFGVIVIALIALTLLQSRQIAETPPPTLIQSLNTVFNFPVLDIVAIRLRNPETDNAVVFRRDTTDGTWITERADAPIVESTAEATAAVESTPEATFSLTPTATTEPPDPTLIARTIVLLPYTRTLEAPEDGNLSIYGFLPEGLFSVEIILIDGTSHGVVIGDISATRESYYAVVDERPEIYILERAPVDFLIQSYQRGRAMRD